MATPVNLNISGWYRFASTPFLRGTDPFNLATAEFSWSGTPGSGNTITLTAEGSGFNTKTQAAPILWVRGSEVYENGVSSSAETGMIDGQEVPWGSASDVWTSASTGDTEISKTSLRNSDVDQQYRGFGTNGGEAGWVGWPNAHLNTATDKNTVKSGDKMYLSYRFKATSNIALGRKIAYTGLSGTFNDGSTDFDIGENCTVTGGVGTVQVLFVDTVNSEVHIQGAVGKGSTDYTGQIMTGDVSGASLSFDVPTEYQNAGSAKPFRGWQGSSSLNENQLRITHGNQNQIITTAYDNLNASQGLAAATVTGPSPSETSTWKKLEYIVDYSGSTGTVRMVEDRTTYSQTGIDLEYLNPNHNCTMANIGLDQSPSVNTEVFFGEIYLDDTFQKVVVGDASTWAACTDFEEMRPTSWTNSQIQAVQHRTPNGLDTGWLYVFDGTDDNAPVNSTGISYS